MKNTIERQMLGFSWFFDDVVFGIELILFPETETVPRERRSIFLFSSLLLLLFFLILPHFLVLTVFMSGHTKTHKHQLFSHFRRERLCCQKYNEPRLEKKKHTKQKYQYRWNKKINTCHKFCHIRLFSQLFNMSNFPIVIIQVFSHRFCF